MRQVFERRSASTLAQECPRSTSWGRSLKRVKATEFLLKLNTCMLMSQVSVSTCITCSPSFCPKVLCVYDQMIFKQLSWSFVKWPPIFRCSFNKHFYTLLLQRSFVDHKYKKRLPQLHQHWWSLNRLLLTSGMIDPVIKPNRRPFIDIRRFIMTTNCTVVFLSHNMLLEKYQHLWNCILRK